MNGRYHYYVCTKNCGNPGQCMAEHCIDLGKTYVAKCKENGENVTMMRISSFNSDSLSDFSLRSRFMKMAIEDDDDLMKTAFRLDSKKRLALMVLRIGGEMETATFGLIVQTYMERIERNSKLLLSIIEYDEHEIEDTDLIIHRVPEEDWRGKEYVRLSKKGERIAEILINQCNPHGYLIENIQMICHIYNEA